MKKLDACIGLAAAVLATALNIAFTALVALYPPTSWDGLDSYVASYDPARLAPVVPALLLAPTVVALFTAIFYYAPEERRIMGRLGLVFAAPYSVMVSINYFVQLTMVRENILHGTHANLEHFIMDNPRSVMFSIDMLGYFFLSLSSLAVSFVFMGGALEKTIRWLFLAAGVLGLVGWAGFASGNSTLSIGTIMSGVAFLPATILLIPVFRRELRMPVPPSEVAPAQGHL